MRLHRFYVLQPLGEEVVIDEVSHIVQWTKVFRYTEGDFVILFNGDGYDSCYSITSISKTSCTLTRTKREPSYIPSKNITLCLSLIKKDNFELVVQKATELGVTTIIPILSARSEKKNLSYERLEKIAIESAEQCGRGDIPIIGPITSLEAFFATRTESSPSYMFTMDGEPFNTLLWTDLGTSNSSASKVQAITLFIGPEGGWSDEDSAIFEINEVKSCSLGKTTLRAETAAIIACAFVAQ